MHPRRTINRAARTVVLVLLLPLLPACSGGRDDLLRAPPALDAGPATATATLVATTAVPSALTAPAASSTPAPLQFESIGIPVDYDSRAHHQALSDLQVWHDRIYLGHGDWDANTGPVRALYLDLQTGAFVHDEGFKFDDEAVENFRVIGDTLIAVGADAREDWSLGNIYQKAWEGRWRKQRTIPQAVHVFDVDRLGRVLVAFGAQLHQNLPEGDRMFGTLWTSTDGGATWTTAQTFERRDGAPDDDPLWVHGGLFVLGDRLFATTPRNGCYTFDGSTWSTTNCVADSRYGVYKHAVFQGAAAMVAYQDDEDGFSSRLHFFDGQQAWSVDLRMPLRDVIARPEGLFVLGSDADGRSAVMYMPRFNCRCERDFTVLGRFDVGRAGVARSLEFARNQFYIGLTDGRLLRSTAFRP